MFQNRHYHKADKAQSARSPWTAHPGACAGSGAVMVISTNESHGTHLKKPKPKPMPLTFQMNIKFSVRLREQIGGDRGEGSDIPNDLLTSQVNRENRVWHTIKNTQNQLHKWKYLSSIFSIVGQKCLFSFKNYWSSHFFFKLSHTPLYQNPPRYLITQADGHWDLKHTHDSDRGSCLWPCRQSTLYICFSGWDPEPLSSWTHSLST